MADQSTYSMDLRRLRQSKWVRDLSRTVHVSHDQFVQPYFVNESVKEAEPLPGLNGVYRETRESLIRRVEQDMEAGVRKILLFGVPATKSDGNFHFDFTANQIRSLKKNFGNELFVSVDVCLCSYTSHGHCGILGGKSGGTGQSAAATLAAAEHLHVVNGPTVAALADAALAYAQAGADCVAPSDMMDGRIAAIRNILDKNSLEQTLLMSYSAKFHSKFYGPFRLAADSAPKGPFAESLKDRATYQIDPANPRDALESSLRDVREGADILMVKPGMPYLDVLASLSSQINRPWAVYEVSGEYAAIELMAAQGLMNGPAAHVESWVALRRAGATAIISYGARHSQEWLKTWF